MYCIVARRFRV